MGIIYKIENDINNKIYVGKTVTTLSNRWEHHMYDYLNKDWHLYKAMRKYGVEHFSIKKIEDCEDERIDEREIYWIDKLDSFYNGYNMTTGGEGRTALDRKRIVKLWNDGYSTLQIANIIGNNWSSSIIEILKQENLYDAEEIKRRKTIDIANKQSSKRIIQYNEKAEIINIYASVKEAEDKTGIHIKNIKNALYSKSGAGGFFWRKEGEAPPKPRKIKISKPHKVAQIDLKTNEIIAIYDNANEAARQIGAIGSAIRAVCRGERHKHHGFGWKDLD